MGQWERAITNVGADHLHGLALKVAIAEVKETICPTPRICRLIDVGVRGVFVIGAAGEGPLLGDTIDTSSRIVREKVKTLESIG